MSMRTNAILAASFMLVTGALTAPSSRTTQDKQEQSSVMGWLEGTVKNPDGRPMGYASLGYCSLALRRTNGQNLAATDPDATEGGLYTFRNVPPGVHELIVSARTVDGVQYAPIHYFGINIEPGKRTILNIVLKPGSDLQEVGQPVCESAKAIVISNELARLQKEIDALKK